MKKKEFYYVDRDGNYHRRTRKAGSHGTRHDPFPWLGLLLAVALLAGAAGVFRYMNHRSVDQTVAALPEGGQPTTRVEVEAGPMEMPEVAAGSEAEGAAQSEGDSLLPSVEELFQETEASGDGLAVLSGDAAGKAGGDSGAGAMIIGLDQEDGGAEPVEDGQESGEAPVGDAGQEAEAPAVDGSDDAETADAGEKAEGAATGEGDDGGAESTADAEGDAAENTDATGDAAENADAEGEATENTDAENADAENADAKGDAVEGTEDAGAEGDAAENTDAAEGTEDTGAEGDAAEGTEEDDTAENADAKGDAAEDTGASLLVRDDPAYLPIAEGIETERKVVAIVIESCGNTGNLKSMLSLLGKQDGAVTLCPAGENLSDKRLVSALREAAEGGAEIEAMDWSTKYLYQMTDQEMAETIWNEGQAINEVLGRNYQPHFYRMRDSRGEVDQRAHDYLDQLGYRAVLRGTAESWTMAASSLKERVRPGAVLLFKTGKTELRNLKELLPWLKNEGYALVTLNELYGLPANETAPLAKAEMPRPRAFEASCRTLREGDYGFEVLELQNRLLELGLLKRSKDLTAFFADRTVEAVRAFQEEQGLEQTGEADPETRRRLMGTDETPSDADQSASEAQASGAEAEAADGAGEAASDAEQPALEAQVSEPESAAAGAQAEAESEAGQAEDEGDAASPGDGEASEEDGARAEGEGDAAAPATDREAFEADGGDKAAA